MCAPGFLWDGVTIPQSASLTAPFTQGSLPYGFFVSGTSRTTFPTVVWCFVKRTDDIRPYG